MVRMMTKGLNGVEKWCRHPRGRHHDAFTRRVVSAPLDVGMGAVSGLFWGLNTIIPGKRASKRRRNWGLTTRTAVRNAAHCVLPGQIPSSRLSHNRANKRVTATRQP